MIQGSVAYVRFFQDLPPFIQALIAGIITVVDCIRGCCSFIFKRVNDKILNSMQGFAAGIMIAASFWSLLQPSIDYGSGSSIAWLPAAIGFYWAVFIRALDLIIPHIHPNTQDTNQYQEGVGTKTQ